MIEDIAITITNLEPRSPLIFCSLALAPRCINFPKSGYSVSSKPHSGGAILRPQYGTANMDSNWFLASSSFKNSISPSERIISLRIQVYHHPLLTLKTAIKEDLSERAVARGTAAASSFFLYPSVETQIPNCGALPGLIQKRSAPSKMPCDASSTSINGSSLFCSGCQKRLVAYSTPSTTISVPTDCSLLFSTSSSVRLASSSTVFPLQC